MKLHEILTETEGTDDPSVLPNVFGLEVSLNHGKNKIIDKDFQKAKNIGDIYFKPRNLPPKSKKIKTLAYNFEYGFQIFILKDLYLIDNDAVKFKI